MKDVYIKQACYICNPAVYYYPRNVCETLYGNSWPSMYNFSAIGFAKTSKVQYLTRLGPVSLFSNSGYVY